MMGETKELVAHVPSGSGDTMQTLQEFSINLTKWAQEVALNDLFFSLHFSLFWGTLFLGFSAERYYYGLSLI